MTFRLANVAGRAALVDDDGGYHDLEALSGGAVGPDPMTAVADHARLHEFQGLVGTSSPTGRVADVVLEAPVPTPTQVFAIGLNYADHVAESGMETPAAPVVFTKFPTCIAGPFAEVPIVGDFIDYEAEVVVVIGTGGRDIARGAAWSHVAGITGGQDVSDRALQFAAKPAHFALGKSRRAYGPIGPIVVSVDTLAEPDDVAVECRVNGETRQQSSTRHLIFDVPHLIEYLSSVVELLPGDLIFTGTPNGVGMATDALLRAGDVVETHIGGVGSLANRCVAG